MNGEDPGPASPHGPGRRSGAGLPLLPGFREMALRRMSAARQQLISDLAAQRQAAGLSQTEVAARMGTSQSAVARLEAGEADLRMSTLERYAAAVGSQLTWRLQAGAAEPAGPGAPGTGAGPGGLEKRGGAGGLTGPGVLPGRSGSPILTEGQHDDPAVH